MSNRGSPPENGETPVGAGAPLKTQIENQTEGRVTANSLRSRSRTENFLSVPSSQASLVRSLPRVYSNKPALAHYGVPTATKALLANIDNVWMFRVSEVGLNYFTVERGEKTWEFGSLEDASDKFHRVVRRVL
jgi:hypothetical protein